MVRAPQRFLAVGRISPEKEDQRCVLGARVRERVPDPNLDHIVFVLDRRFVAPFRSLTSLASSLGSWISSRDSASRDEIRGLMASHRYGIHGMLEEHFGMGARRTGARRDDRRRPRVRADGDRRREPPMHLTDEEWLRTS